MFDAISIVMMLAPLPALLVAPVLYARGQRAAACSTYGAALSVVVIGTALLVALSPDPGLNAGGIGAWFALLAIAVFVLHSVRRPARQTAAFFAASFVCLGLVVALIYLLFFFKIF